MNIDNGVFSVQSMLGNISAADIGFIFAYGDSRKDVDERSVVVTGNPTPPLRFGSLEISLPNDNVSIPITLPAGFNPQQTFDKHFYGRCVYQ